MPEKSGFFFDFQSDLKMAFSGMKNTGWYLAYLLLVLYLFSGTYVVKTNEVGVLTRLGKVINRGVKPGLHYRFPWPIDRVDKVKIKEVKRMEVGFWVENIKTETKTRTKIVKAGYDQMESRTDNTIKPYCLTGDKNIVHCRVAFQYLVKDPVQFLYEVKAPETLLKNIVRGVIIASIARMPVDEVLTVGKHRLEQQIRLLSQAKLDSLGCGIQIASVELKNASPPQDTLDAFKDVINAQEEKNTLVHEAEAYRNQIIPEAQAQALVIRQQAQAYKVRKIAHAEGEAKRFLGMLAEYSKSKKVTRERLYIELLEEILPRMKKYIIAGKDEEDVVRLKFFLKEKQKQ